MGYFRFFFVIIALSAFVLQGNAQPAPGGSSPLEAELTDARQLSVAHLTVALLKSDYTSRYFAEKWQYENVIYRWLTFFAESGIKHKLITDRDLEQESLDGFDILVLPAALCLSEAERSAIRGFAASGRGVIATWATGVRAADGEWVGWDMLEGLTGSRFVGYLKGSPATWLTLTGRSPLSVGLGPGYRIELIGGWKVGLSIASRDGYWSDFNLRPETIGEETEPIGAAAHGSLGKGRVVWLGFNTTAVASNSVNQKALTAVLKNAVHWVGRVPISSLWYWPNNHQGAAVFSQDVEYLFHNAASSVEILRKEGVPGTFFCVSDLATGNEDLVRAFSEIGEVGTHSDDHSQFKGQPFDQQYRRLEKSVVALENMGGVEIRGMRPPFELCDQATLTAWAMLGGEYIFGQPEYNPRMIPELVQVEKDPSRGLEESKTLVLIPRAVRDDHTTLVVEALAENDEIVRQHSLDLDWVYDMSGLCMFGYHSNLVCLPERAEVLSRMVRYAKGLDLWLTTAGEVADWWRDRANVSVEILSASADHLVVSAANSGDSSVEDLSIVMYLPEAPNGVDVTCDSSDLLVPRHTLQGSRLVLHLDSLEADAVETYRLSFLEEPQGDAVSPEPGDDKEVSP